jgi:hypothetical protein
MQVCEWQKIEIKRLLSSWRQLQLFRAILEEISVVRLSSNQLLEVESHAPTDIASESNVIESIAVIRYIAEAGARADWTVVLEELRLDRETDAQFTALDTVTYVPKHHVVCVAHSLRSQFPQEPPCATL